MSSCQKQDFSNTTNSINVFEVFVPKLRTYLRISDVGSSTTSTSSTQKQPITSSFQGFKNETQISLTPITIYSATTISSLQDSKNSTYISDPATSSSSTQKQPLLTPTSTTQANTETSSSPYSGTTLLVSSFHDSNNVCKPCSCLSPDQYSQDSQKNSIIVGVVLGSLLLIAIIAIVCLMRR